MAGDFARLTSAYGASYPGTAIGPAAAMIASGLFGKIVYEGHNVFLMPDERAPQIFRQLGKMHLGDDVSVERLSFDSEHEKAILGLQFLQKIAEVARARATDANGTVNTGVLAALMGEAATTDLRRIVDELAAAGMSVVEKVTTKTFTTRVVVLTTNPEAAREGELVADAITFESPTAETGGTVVEVFDASRTRELLLSPQSMREVAPLVEGEPAPIQNTAELNLMRLLNLDGTLTMDDVGLDLPDDDEPGDGARPHM